MLALRIFVRPQVLTPGPSCLARRVKDTGLHHDFCRVRSSAIAAAYYLVALPAQLFIRRWRFSLGDQLLIASLSGSHAHLAGKVFSRMVLNDTAASCSWRLFPLAAMAREAAHALALRKQDAFVCQLYTPERSSMVRGQDSSLARFSVDRIVKARRRPGFPDVALRPTYALATQRGPRWLSYMEAIGTRHPYVSGSYPIQGRSPSYAESFRKVCIRSLILCQLSSGQLIDWNGATIDNIEKRHGIQNHFP